ncbi:glutathione S-transferase [Thalassovita sp.]|uniref:glutathione S-transferase n=1 Tax=Thalassovita sp. TaxID=1979401 RepID=UPI0029DE824F|nr:glutathione S-transferase [Thalassovita sp.]
MGQRMKLHWSPRSPFVRKVMIVLHETGLTDEVELSRNVVAVQIPTPAEVLADNPLGKIPALVTEDGRQLVDSRVICEYLDLRAGTGLFPSELRLRSAHLNWQALADGMTDVLLVWRTELTRENGPWQAVVDSWRVKVQATMARFEAETDQIAEAPFGIGHVALVAALGQLDFRWPDCGWRNHFLQLAALEAKLAGRPSVVASKIRDDEGSDAGALTRRQLTFGV